MSSKAKKREKEIALNTAIKDGRIEEVAQLLREGVDPNAFDDKWKNPYALTAICNAIDGASYRSLRIGGELAEIRKSVNPNTPAYDQHEERAKRMEILRLLLGAGADPNYSTLTRTPLNFAVHIGDTEIARILLDAGARPSGESWSPMSKLPKPKRGLAFYANSIHEAATGYTDIVRLLCERGAEITALDHEGRTPLQIAIAYHQTEIIQILQRCSESS